MAKVSSSSFDPVTERFQLMVGMVESLRNLKLEKAIIAVIHDTDACKKDWASKEYGYYNHDFTETPAERIVSFAGHAKTNALMMIDRNQKSHVKHL